jgi:hypothetical protein
VLSLVSAAQQMAASDGKPVEIRLLQYTAVGGSGKPDFQTVLLLHHYSLNEIGPDYKIVTLPQGISVLAADPVVLPGGIVISANANLGVSNITINSNLVAPATGGTSQLGQLEVLAGGVLTPYNLTYLNNLTAYCSVIVYANGTSLPDPTQSWYFSLVNENDEANQNLQFSGLHNFYCIQIDPYNGHATSYRP